MKGMDREGRGAALATAVQQLWGECGEGGCGLWALMRGNTVRGAAGTEGSLVVMCVKKRGGDDFKRCPPVHCHG